MIGGKSSIAEAARTHAVPEAELEKWLLAAEAGISEALGNLGSETADEQDKVRTLAREYSRLRAENRALKARQ